MTERGSTEQRPKAADGDGARMPAAQAGAEPPSAIAGMQAISRSLVSPLDELQLPQAGRGSGGAHGNETAGPMARILGRAWRATLALRPDRAAAQIALAEAVLAGTPPDVSHRYRNEIVMLRAAGLAFSDEALPALSVALTGSRAGQTSENDVASTIRRLGYWRLGDSGRFEAIGRRGRPERLSRRWALRTVFDLSIESAAAFEQLRLPLAKRLAFDALALSDRSLAGESIAATLPASILAQIFYEEGRLDEADAMITGRLSAIREGGTVESAIRAYTVVARVASHRHQPDLASIVLQEAEALGERRNWPRLVCASISGRLELLLRCGQVDEAGTCAQRLERLAGRRSSGDSFSRGEITRFAAFGRYAVALAEGQMQSAVAGLRQAHFEAISGRQFHRGFHLGMSLARALAVAGEVDDATGILQEAAKIAATVGLFQAFVDGGPPVRNLLERCYGRNVPAEEAREGARSFVGWLLDRGADWQSARNEAKMRARSRAHLSERERRVLKHISEGFSNKKIAQVLGIKPETVKSHVKHIFTKLAVGTRAEAVAKGETLGLI